MKQALKIEQTCVMQTTGSINIPNAKQCFLPDAFTSIWNQIIPMYKKVDSAHPFNYRTISFLPTMSIIFEEIFHVQLYQYFTDNRFKAEQQYGLHSQHSTEFVKIKLIDHISRKVLW